VAGMPLVFVRGQEGELNGFVNACRHRGARLKPPGASNQRALICPYHSWTYGLDGTLRGRPSVEDFPHAPASDCGLARVPVAEALGFVWAIPRVVANGESARIDIDNWLGRFGADLRSWGYDSWVPFHQHAFDNAANWKIPFEANLETYHFQYAHRNSIAALFYDNLLMADHDRQHQRLFLPKRSIEGLRGTPTQAWQVGPHSNIIYYFFPATFILHEGDHANAFTVLPESPGRSRVIASTLVPELPKTEKSVNYWRKNVESFWGALDEDFALGVSAQSTLASGAQASLYFGTTEWCSAKFHADVEAALAK
jgi:phenylpropionate dioxygenase-like ring-hydroxylating dioxygenase large terminal subunit